MKLKSTGTAYLCLLPCLLGVAGVNRFYLGKIGSGILYLLTFGWFGIGIIYDLFTIPNQVRLANLLLSGGGFVQANQNVIVNVHTSQPAASPLANDVTKETTL